MKICLLYLQSESMMTLFNGTIDLGHSSFVAWNNFCWSF